MYVSETYIRVKYSETDQMGYVYYGNYAEYYEVGRAEALRGLGLSYKQLEAGGYMTPVYEMNIKYKRPARYDDLLRVVTKIIKIEGVRFYFEYEIYNEKGDLINEGLTIMFFVLKENGRPVRPPLWFTEIISKYIEVC